MLKYFKKNFIDMGDWDNLVTTTYKRPYNFQQQEGCKPRGIVSFSAPDKYTEDEEMNDTIPEIVNGNKMGVKFEVWLARNPKQKIPNQTQPYELELFWERNFYPDFQTIVNDLYKKGLILKGDYIINIDW